MSALTMKSLTGQKRSLDETTLQPFAQSLRGALIKPDDPDYDQACGLYNAMIDKRPGLIARCADGAYVNFMMEEGQERVQATYRDNH